MNPWDELAEPEKREAIARRLGWTRTRPAPDGEVSLHRTFPWKDANGVLMYRTENWPTNDGLAFAEVWPKVCALPGLKYAHLCVDSNYQRYASIWFDSEVWGSSPSESWAEIICEAAYQLLSEPK